MKYLLLMIIVCILSSCKWSNANLGDNYYYLDKDEAVDVGFPGGAIIYKSTERYVFKDIKISGDVLKVKSDNQFIIAEQIPKSNPNRINYYIIQKKENIIYGPLSCDSLNIMINELKVGLELNNKSK